MLLEMFCAFAAVSLLVGVYYCVLHGYEEPEGGQHGRYFHRTRDKVVRKGGCMSAGFPARRGWASPGIVP